MRKSILTFAIIGTFASVAAAQDGTGVQAGPFRVKPTLGVTVGSDSNVAQSSVNEVSSFYTRVSPGIRFDSGNEARSLSLAYELDAGRYSDSEQDDYNDQRLSAGVKVSPSVRTRLNLDAGLERGHDRRGTNSRQGTQIDFQNRDADKWDRRSLDAGFDYGAPGARGALGLQTGIANLDYINNEDYSRFGDRDLKYVSARFGWRVAPKTQLFASARNSSIDYDQDRVLGNRILRLDSDERLYLVGVQFDATAKTSGSIGVGQVRKDFDDPSIRSYSGTAWDVGLQFRPRSYSVIDLSTARATQEAVNFLGGFSDTEFLINRSFTLAWTHGWTDRFNTGLDVGRENLSYQAASREIRNDALNFWGISADYKLRDWFSIGAGYKSYRRNGDVQNAPLGVGNIFDYDRDEVNVSFEASL